ncbi:hypothetical protein Tco_1006852 [Tanacetum coccineum]|uniref:Tektin n=1 Tax=Tanacetum coccineum TaxID=301880 RepID=A0ABQ5FK11_9ASTR
MEPFEEGETVPTPPSPPPSRLSPLSSPLPRILSPPLLLPSPTRRDIILKADMPPQKRDIFAAPSHRFEIGENREAMYARQAWSQAMGCNCALQDKVGVLQADLRALQKDVNVLQRQRMDDGNRLTMHIEDDIAKDIECARDPE